jgi:hypothetical protein
MTNERIRRCLDTGTTVFVGTLDGKGVPSCCRAVAVRSDDELATATVYVPLATSRETIANVATTHRVAIVLTRPIEHAAVQLKGTSTAARLARADEEPFVRSRIDGLADVLHHLGVPRSATRSVAHWPAFAIEMTVDEIYEQTPGPRAGSRLK